MIPFMQNYMHIYTTPTPNIDVWVDGVHDASSN